MATVTIAANKSASSGHVNIIPDEMGFLASLFKSFDRVRWGKCHFYYKPAVGTTYGGLITIGVDWDFASTAETREKVATLTPAASFAAWADTEGKPMILPANRLQSRAWYTPRSTSGATMDWRDRGPAKVFWAASGSTATAAQTLGELWCEYTATLSGTNPA